MPATPLTEFRFLSNTRISRIIGTLAAKLELERPLVYLAKLPLVPAFNDELIGRFTGRVFAADLVADDQKAVVTEGMSLEVVSHAIPNVKTGQKLDQKLLDRLAEYEERGGAQGEDALRDWEQKLALNLLTAVRWRLNAMAAAMMTDNWSYNRFGIQLSGATWGMPSDLKVTVGTAWGANPTTATPVSDIFTLQQTAEFTYGIKYDTMTLGRADFNDMVKTTEFANKATLNLGQGVAFLLTPAALATMDIAKMKELAGRLFDLEIEIDEHVTRERQADASQNAYKTLPLHNVLFTRKADTGNGATWDMANGVVTESRGEIPGVPANSRGPVAYYTPVSHDYNPPGQIAWAVAKSFPRKHLPEASAVLIVG
jgi:hypothetical protein